MKSPPRLDYSNGCNAAEQEFKLMACYGPDCTPRHRCLKCGQRFSCRHNSIFAGFHTKAATIYISVLFMVSSFFAMHPIIPFKAKFENTTMAPLISKAYRMDPESKYKSLTTVYRDRRGNIREEVEYLTTDKSRTDNNVIRIRFTDTSWYILYPQQKRAIKGKKIADHTYETGIPEPKEKMDLGTKVILGLKCRGIKVTASIRSNLFEWILGFGTTKKYNLETWTSIDLDYPVYREHESPSGHTMTGMIDVKVGVEPSPELFEVPKDYKIEDTTNGP